MLASACGAYSRGPAAASSSHEVKVEIAPASAVHDGARTRESGSAVWASAQSWVRAQAWHTEDQPIALRLRGVHAALRARRAAPLHVLLVVVDPDWVPACHLVAAARPLLLSVPVWVGDVGGCRRGPRVQSFNSIPMVIDHMDEDAHVLADAVRVEECGGEASCHQTVHARART